MKTYIRLLIALVIATAFADINGLRPEFFSNLITTWGVYAYIGVSLVISWLSMPAVSEYFFE